MNLTYIFIAALLVSLSGVAVQSLRLQNEKAAHQSTKDRALVAAMQSALDVANDALSKSMLSDEVSRLKRDQEQLAQVERDTGVETREEKIRYVTRTVEVPAHCPIALPAGVQSELSQAVNEAAAAKRRLQAALD